GLGSWRSSGSRRLFEDRSKEQHERLTVPTRSISRLFKLSRSSFHPSRFNGTSSLSEEGSWQSGKGSEGASFTRSISPSLNALSGESSDAYRARGRELQGDWALDSDSPPRNHTPLWTEQRRKEHDPSRTPLCTRDS